MDPEWLRHTPFPDWRLPGLALLLLPGVGELLAAVAVLLHWHSARLEERRLLAEAVAGWGEKYPEVLVRRLVVHGSAASQLVRFSHRAQLLVVGARGLGGFAGLAVGSVSQAAIHHAACPVVVVHASAHR